MTDRVAIVTGGLRGPGRGMTLGLAASGVRVLAVTLAWDTSPPPAEAARRNGRPAGLVLHPQDMAAFPAG